MEDYEITQEDINSMVRYLKYHDPEVATPENAEFVLEQMLAEAQLMSHEDIDNLEKIKLGIDEESKRWKEIEKILKRKDV